MLEHTNSNAIMVIIGTIEQNKATFRHPNKFHNKFTVNGPNVMAMLLNEIKTPRTDGSLKLFIIC